MADPYVVNNHTWKIFAWYFSITDSYCNVSVCWHSGDGNFTVFCAVSGAFVGCSCFFGTEFNAKGVLYALVIGNVAAFISDLLARKLGDVLEGTGKNEVETNE